VDGTLYPSDIILPDGSTPRVLDVLELGLKRPRPEDHHPEDWVIDGRRWRLVARPMVGWSDWIGRQSFETGPTLLGGFDDRIPFGAKVDHSLALLRVADLHWRIMVRDNRRKLRVRFLLGDQLSDLLGGQLYDLGVTDDQLEGRFSTWREGVYPLALAPGFEDAGEAVLTVSLGEPFAPVEDGPAYCFKLAAAVIPLERDFASHAREVPHNVDEHAPAAHEVETVRFQRQPGWMISRLRKLGLLPGDTKER